jgi:hypothetical protein
MQILILLILSFLVGLSGAIYLHIFRRVYRQDGGKVITNAFGRVDAYLALGCITIFAVQCLQNFRAGEYVIPSTINTGLLVAVHCMQLALRRALLIRLPQKHLERFC